MARWMEVPIGAPVLTNVDETALDRQSAALENGYVNDVGGHTRFPGSVEFADISDGLVYLREFRGDLMAVTSLGRVWRIDRNGNSKDVTSAAVTGGRRVIFAETEDELLMVAGGKIIAYPGGKTRILSEDAPEASHVVYTGGYVAANELDSGRWRYTPVGDYDNWPVLNIFSAESKPDRINAAIVTPYEELLFAGPRSLEQFEKSPSGTAPFYRRWAAGDGLLAPYTLSATKFGTFGINSDAEFVRYVNQTTNPESDLVQSTLDGIDAWANAWAKEVIMFGQRFILLQMPEATNLYGTKGVTLLYDQRRKYWSTLYGWDADLGLPARWPGWDHEFVWSRHFIGGEGKVYELKRDAYSNAGTIQRYLGRSGHYDLNGNTLRIDDCRMRFKRGTTNPNTSPAPRIAFRYNADNEGFSSWMEQSLGLSGDRQMVLNFGSLGSGDTFQFEWFVTDEAPIELAKLEILVEIV
jgi:hypothetical protein